MDPDFSAQVGGEILVLGLEYFLDGIDPFDRVLMHHPRSSDAQDLKRQLVKQGFALNSVAHQQRSLPTSERFFWFADIDDAWWREAIIPRRFRYSRSWAQKKQIVTLEVCFLTDRQAALVDAACLIWNSRNEVGLAHSYAQPEAM